MPEFTEQAIAETDGGALTWLLHALDLPDYNATLHGYGTVIGTGNAVVEWPAAPSGGLGMTVVAFQVPVHPHLARPGQRGLRPFARCLR